MSKAILLVQMQSGCEYDFCGEVADQVHDKLLSLQSAPIAGNSDSDPGGEVTIVPRYVESHRWFPNGVPPCKVPNHP